MTNVNYMAKNYQLIHRLSRNKSSSSSPSNSSNKSKSSTSVYIGTCLTNRESFAIKITDLDEFNDIELILVSIKKQNQNLTKY